MPIRFRPKTEPWTPTGREIQANIEARTRIIAAEVNGGKQATLALFEQPESKFSFRCMSCEAEQIPLLA